MSCQFSSLLGLGWVPRHMHSSLLPDGTLPSHYVSPFSPVTLDVCEWLWVLSDCGVRSLGQSLAEAWEVSKSQHIESPFRSVSNLKFWAGCISSALSEWHNLDKIQNIQLLRFLTAQQHEVFTSLPLVSGVCRWKVASVPSVPRVSSLCS